jgi:hypothetical protein
VGGTLFGPCPSCQEEAWVIVKNPTGEHVLRCASRCGFEVLMSIVTRKPWITYSATHTAVTGRR